MIPPEIQKAIDELARKRELQRNPNAGPIRNLIFHLTPTANYQWSLGELLKRWEVFNGRKVIAVAQGPDLERIENVIPQLPLGCRYFTLKNHPILRETASLGALLLEASEFDRSGITFYAHSKGTTRGVNPAVKLWTESMFHYCLDRLDLVDEAMKNKPLYGVYKSHRRHTEFPRMSRHHYSGTFWWFQNKALFDKPNWSNVPQMKYGAESYASLLFRDNEAPVPFKIFDNFRDGYNYEYMKSILKSVNYPLPLE